MKFTRMKTWWAVAIGVLAVTSVQARPIPLVKASAVTGATSLPQLVGNGVYQATTSVVFASPSQWPLIPFTNGSQPMTAPIVVHVFWPGASTPDPQMHALCGDFVTDLFDGPYWNATMPQYMGSAHGAYQSRVDLPSLLTLAPSATVHSRYIGAELLAQQQAGVLPVADTLLNTVYVVHFPPGITITDETYQYVDYAGRLTTHVSIGTSCLQYCAYHDEYISYPPLRAFAFVVMPDFSQNSSCSGSCGYGSPFDVYTEVLSHELFETVTDPYGTGWFDSPPAGEQEIADVCEQWKFYVPRRTSTPGTPRCPSN